MAPETLKVPERVAQQVDENRAENKLDRVDANVEDLHYERLVGRENQAPNEQGDEQFQHHKAGAQKRAQPVVPAALAVVAFGVGVEREPAQEGLEHIRQPRHGGDVPQKRAYRAAGGLAHVERENRLPAAEIPAHSRRVIDLVDKVAAEKFVLGRPRFKRLEAGAKNVENPRHHIVHSFENVKKDFDGFVHENENHGHVHGNPSQRVARPAKHKEE